jgi:hypothetical protein
MRYRGRCLSCFCPGFVIVRSRKKLNSDRGVMCGSCSYTIIVLRQVAAPQLRTLRFEAIYMSAVTIRAGEGATALRVLRDGAWHEWF